MLDWKCLPQEEVYLLNPFFCSLLIASSVKGYVKESQAGMPYAIMFIALPVVLHKQTRESLPRGINTSLAAWLDVHSEARARLADRATALVPFVREAVLFGLTRGLVRLSQDGNIFPGIEPKETAKYIESTTDEIKDCIKRSWFVGRWFAHVGTSTTLMALWGVRP